MAQVALGARQLQNAERDAGDPGANMHDEVQDVGQSHGLVILPLTAGVPYAETSGQGCNERSQWIGLRRKLYGAALASAEEGPSFVVGRHGHDGLRCRSRGSTTDHPNVTEMAAGVGFQRAETTAHGFLLLQAWSAW